LGSLHGASDIQRDPFFHGINWARMSLSSFFLHIRLKTVFLSSVLRHTTPPIIPAVTNPLEGNFRNIVDDLYNKGFRMEKEKGLSSEKIHSSDPFKNFVTGPHLSFFALFFSSFPIIKFSPLSALRTCQQWFRKRRHLHSCFLTCLHHLTKRENRLVSTLWKPKHLNQKQKTHYQKQKKRKRKKKKEKKRYQLS